MSIFDRFKRNSRLNELESTLSSLQESNSTLDTTLQSLQTELRQKDDAIATANVAAEAAFSKARIYEDSLRRLEMEDAGWYSVSGSAVSLQRDLSNSQRQRLSKESWDAFSFNPRAWRIMNTFKIMVISRNLSIYSNIPDIDIAIKRFMKERRNKWLWQTTQLVNRFGLEGEIFIRFWLLKDGKVIFREIPPSEILDIVRSPSDKTVELYYKKLLPGKPGIGSMSSRLAASMGSNSNYEYVPSIEILYYDDVKDALLNSPVFNKESTRFASSVGNIDKLSQIKVLSDINSVNQSSVNVSLADPGQDQIDFYSFVLHVDYPTISDRYRGFSLLQPILKVLKQYRELLQYRLHLAKIRASMVYDISVDGDVGAVQKEAAKHRFPPAPGSVNVHSKQITHSYLYPSVGADDVRGDVRALSLEAVAGSLLPEHLSTGDASNANFASLRDTRFSFSAVVEAWQDIWIYIYTEMIRVVLFAAIRTKQIKSEYEVPYTYADESEQYQTIDIKQEPINLVKIDMPSVTGDSLLELAQAAQLLKDMELASQPTLATKLGFDYLNRERPLIRAQRDIDTKDFISNEKKVGAELGQPNTAVNGVKPPVSGAQTKSPQNVNPINKSGTK